jgi:hypothetical protein
MLRELLASGEASLPPCDQLEKQCWLAEVGYNSGRTGTARLPYLAVKKQFERLTDYDAVSKQFVQKRGYDRWKAEMKRRGAIKYLGDVMRAEGLEHQCMDICARLALGAVAVPGTALGSILREMLASGEASLLYCDELDRQRWLAEVGYNSERPETALKQYLAVSSPFDRLKDFGR